MSPQTLSRVFFFLAASDQVCGDIQSGACAP